MKKLFYSIFILSLLILSIGLDYTPVFAYAYQADFVSTIHYQNIGQFNATIFISIYDSEGNEISGPQEVANLAPNAATSIYAGSIAGLSGDFQGSAVLTSDQPLASVVAQVGSGAVKNQPLSTGFTVGASSVHIPTVLKNMWHFHTIFAVQNIDSSPADLALTFVTVEGNQTIVTKENLPPRSSYYVDMGDFAEIVEPSFNGSVKIDSVQSGTSNPGEIVATSMELQITGNNAYSFNGAFAPTNKIYMPSALCAYYGSTTSYAVQNTTPNDIQVTVTYSNGKMDGPYTLSAFSKRSFDGCRGGLYRGFLGSAIVSSTGGDILAVGKVYGAGLYPAHMGFTGGNDMVALPLVRWTEKNWSNGTGQRTFIAVQNIGTSNLSAGEVKAHYYDKNGSLVGTHELDAILVGKKANTWAKFLGPVGYEFGYYSDGSSGGSVIIEAPEGNSLAVIVRVEKRNGGSKVGEDYEGIPITIN